MTTAMNTRAALILWPCLVGLSVMGAPQESPPPPKGAAEATPPGEKKPTDAERVAEIFRGHAKGMAADVIAEIKRKSPQETEEMKKQLGANDESELPDKCAGMLTRLYSKALSVTDEDAKNLLAGTFDDKANRKVIESAVEQFTNIHATLSGAEKYWVDRFLSKRIKDGFELEFAARVLYGGLHFKKNRAMRDKAMKSAQAPQADPQERPVLSDADRDRLQGLMRKLGSSSFKERDEAMQSLEEAGDAAEPFLRDALRSEDAEVRARAKLVLKRMGWFFREVDQ